MKINTAENVKRIMADMWSESAQVRDAINEELKALAERFGVTETELSTREREGAGSITMLRGRAAVYDSASGQPLTWTDTKSVCSDLETAEWMLGYNLAAKKFYS